MTTRIRSIIYIAIVAVVLIIAVWGVSWAASGWGAATNQAGTAAQGAQQTLDRASSPRP